MDNNKLLTTESLILERLSADSVTISAGDVSAKTNAERFASLTGYDITWQREGAAEVGYCRRK